MIKLQTYNQQLLVKIDSRRDVFQWILRILQSSFLMEHLWMVASEEDCNLISSQYYRQMFSTVTSPDMPRAVFKTVQNLVFGSMNKKLLVVIITAILHYNFQKRNVKKFFETYCKHICHIWGWIFPVSQVFEKHQMGLVIYGPCYNFKLENSFESKLT